MELFKVDKLLQHRKKWGILLSSEVDGQRISSLEVWTFLPEYRFPLVRELRPS